MKRIQIRFISLISENFFKAKRAHPNDNSPDKELLAVDTVKKRNFIKSWDHCGLFFIHTFFSLHCCGIYCIGGQIREIVVSTRQGVGPYRDGMKLYFRLSRVFFGSKMQ